MAVLPAEQRWWIQVKKQSVVADGNDTPGFSAARLPFQLISAYEPYRCNNRGRRTSRGILCMAFDERKYQMHYESDQFHDERNEDVEPNDIAQLSKHPGWAKFLNMQIKQHYGQYFKEAA